MNYIHSTRFHKERKNTQYTVTTGPRRTISAQLRYLNTQRGSCRHTITIAAHFRFASSTVSRCCSTSISYLRHSRASVSTSFVAKAVKESHAYAIKRTFTIEVYSSHRINHILEAEASLGTEQEHSVSSDPLFEFPRYRLNVYCRSLQSQFFGSGHGKLPP